MKQCSKCGSVLPLSEYQIRSKEKGTYRGLCRQCRTEYNHTYYVGHSEKYKNARRTNRPRYRAQHRVQLLQYLSDKQCVDCGERDPVVLELDHVGGQKNDNVGDMMGRYGWNRILKEIAKCEVRCANCHQRKTARDFKWFKGDFGV
jgi:DNA-directed RNA polymerase subunit M/transcription elongation factor TFIIS